MAPGKDLARRGKAPPEHVYWGTMLALLEMVSRGITCFADMYFFMDQAAEAARQSGMRCALCRGLVGSDKKKLEEGVDLVRRFHEPSGMIHVQLGPHAIYTVPPEAFREISMTARDLGVGVHTHWLETEWEAGYIREELGKDPVDLLFEVGLSEVPHAILATASGSRRIGSNPSQAATWPWLTTPTAT